MSDNEYDTLEHFNSIGADGTYYRPEYIFLPKLWQLVFQSKGKKKLVEIVRTGITTKSLFEFQKLIESYGGKLVHQKHDDTQWYYWEDAFLSLFYNIKDNNVVLECNTVNPKLLEMMEILDKEFISKNKKNKVFAIAENEDGFFLKEVGNGGLPFIKENYSPDVLKDVEYVISSFQKTPPNGRICILSGEPGTGKTHLIRSIMSEMDTIFIVVPANMIDSMDKPTLIPLLLDTKKEHDKSIIMIIEDGDTCLVPRKNDNISAITSLLNLSDGILGSLIDIKMIISTNAYIRDIDQAIMRPGRLCRSINVPALSYEQANKVFQRLSNDLNASLTYRKDGYTLAEIYAYGDDLMFGTTSNFVPKQSAIGFQRNNTDLTINRK